MVYAPTNSYIGIRMEGGDIKPNIIVVVFRSEVSGNPVTCNARTGVDIPENIHT